MLTLTKEFRFEAAHRLAKGYAGKCANIHGHSWVGRIEVTRAEDELNEFDMLIDFADIKKVIASEVDALDHSCIVYEKDDLLSYLIVHGQRYYALPANPTSEILAEHLFKVFNEKFNKLGARVVSLTIEETCTCACTVNDADNGH